MQGSPAYGTAALDHFTARAQAPPMESKVLYYEKVVSVDSDTFRACTVYMYMHVQDKEMKRPVLQLQLVTCISTVFFLAISIPAS